MGQLSFVVICSISFIILNFQTNFVLSLRCHNCAYWEGATGSQADCQNAKNLKEQYLGNCGRISFMDTVGVGVGQQQHSNSMIDLHLENDYNHNNNNHGSSIPIMYLNPKSSSSRTIQGHNLTPYCAKLNPKISGRKVTLRLCAHEYQPDLNGQCVSTGVDIRAYNGNYMLGTIPAGETICYCNDKDACNGVAGGRRGFVGLISLLLISSLLLILRK